MRRFSTVAVFVLVTLLFVSTGSAQQTPTTSVPSLIRYSGTLKDVQGAALASTAPVGVTFAIYDQQDGGAAVWQETQNVAPDSNGQYSVILGSTTAAGLPDDLFSQQEQRWLGVQVQGQEEQARVLLVSVPYAFKAHEADTLGGLSASAFVRSSSSASGGGSTTAGTTVNAVNHVGNTGNTQNGKGAAGSAKAPCSQLTGTGTPSYIAYWDTSSGCDLGPSAIYQSALGYIGIGATTNLSPLTVNNSTASPLAVVSVTQNAPTATSGFAIYAVSNAYTIDAVSNDTTGFSGAIRGYGSAPSGFGIFGGETSATGVNYGVYGRSSSTSGIGVWGSSTATTGSTVGVRASVSSPAGTIISGQNNAVEQFSVDANGNVKFGVNLATLSIGSAADQNLFLGVGAGVNTVTGSGIHNFFAGYKSGSANTTGFSNVFMGYQAGQANIDQSYNTYVGANAGSNADSSANTFIGYSAGSNTSGTSYGITAVGYNAGRANTVGTLNAYFGVNAGFNSVGAPPATGSQNTYLGNGAGSSANLGAGSNNIFVGSGAGNAENNVNNNIEIGFSGPASTGGNTIVIGTHGVQTAAFMAGFAASAQPANVYYNTASGQLFATSNVGIGGGCSSGFGYITYWLSTSTLGCSGIFQAANGFIGVGTTSPSAAVDVNGDINARYDLSSYQIGEHTVLQISGTQNLAVGVDACTNGAGGSNTCVGYGAGSADNGGYYNTFIGEDAGAANQGGNDNTFLGTSAGQSNIAGTANVAVGAAAGFTNNNSNNVFVGQGAGYSNTGSSNIYVGYGVDNASESNTIRIGSGQSAAYIAGVNGVNNSGVAVYINGSGQLGTTSSSRRFKEQVTDMGDSSSKLLQLRPVTFFYKPEYDDSSHALQYGLIAEEVANVYPEMVAYDKDGQPYTVKYQYLAPMLLNELQKQQALASAQQDVIQTQREQVNAQQQQMQAQQQQIEQLQQRLSRLESLIANK